MDRPPLPENRCAARTNMGGRCEKYATFLMAITPLRGGETRLLPCCGTHYGLLRRGGSLELAEPPGDHRRWVRKES